MLANCLWEGVESNATLVLLHTEEQDIRFGVSRSAFKPLASQINALSFAVKLQLRNGQPDQSFADFTAGVTDEMPKHVDQHLERFVGNVRELLDALWSSERSDMNRYAREVHEALEQVGKIENFKRRVNEMQQQEFTTWASFVTTVLQLDHEVIPQGSSVKSRVVNLDSVRQQLTQLWHNESVETRRQIAQALRGLADNVENRR